MGMFCNQCEQTAKGYACTVAGVCGKQASTAGLHDILLYQLRGIGYCAHQLRKNGSTDKDADLFVIEGLFTTVTNVNFDDQRIVNLLRQSETIKRNLLTQLQKSVPTFDTAVLPETVTFVPAGDTAGLQAQASACSLLTDDNEDIRSLRQLLVYGLRGMAAYADHAWLLGKKDNNIIAFIHEALAALNEKSITMEALVNLNMKCGSTNVRCMELLDEAHRARFGNPEPTSVSTGTKAGPAIIVTGHDLVDLEELLKQTEGSGINIYTHGEMLPAHGYPELKKYPHLAGHFGTAWQNQQKEFDEIPAAVLFTTNCIQKPKENYIDRVFTTGLVGWPGVAHVTGHDFSTVIATAKKRGGFTESKGGTLLTGFGHTAVLGIADKVIDAVKSGAIKRFFLIGGCDGAKPGRNYYTDLAQSVPKDCVILTLACGKFRFNDLDFGTIGGIPRLLDIGQCNDAFSAVKIALALADAFKCSINDLPLSIILSWYEQKAVVILLSLLSLGVKGIRLGPTLPAFISPNVLDFLVKNFDIKPTGDAKEDLAAIMG